MAGLGRPEGPGYPGVMTRGQVSDLPLGFRGPARSFWEYRGCLATRYARGAHGACPSDTVVSAVTREPAPGRFRGGSNLRPTPSKTHRQGRCLQLDEYFASGIGCRSGHVVAWVFAGLPFASDSGMMGTGVEVETGWGRSVAFSARKHAAARDLVANRAGTVTS